MAYDLIDPDVMIDHSIDWTSWLDPGVSIVGNPTWSIYPTGPTLSNPSITGNIATVFIAGCALGVVYKLTCHIVTDAAVAQTQERSIELRCDHR